MAMNRVVTDEDRYDRQKRVENWDQECISNAKCLVIGAGALGNEVVKNLAQLGIKRIYLVDFDDVVMANLNRCVLLREEDVIEGATKAKAISERIKRINSETEIIPIEQMVEEVDEEIYDKADVVISCLDNIAARLHVNGYAYARTKPLIDGGIDGLFGKVQVVIPPRTACIECTMSKRDYQNMWKRYSCSLEEISAVEKKMPALPTTTSIIAGIQIQEFIKLMHEIKGKKMGETMGGKLWTYNGANEEVDILHIEKRKKCNVCGFFGCE